MKNMDRMKEATAVAVTGPGAEPIAMVLPLLTVNEDPLLQRATSDAAVDAAAFLEHMRKLDMDWRDPFYSGKDNNRDETVQASFEIDHDVVDDELKSEYATFVMIITGLPLALFLLYMLRSYWKSHTLVAAVTFLVLFCIGQGCLFGCCGTGEPTKDMFVARRLHVALGRDGIYLDDADQSNRNLARRHVIPFAAVATCRIVEVGSLRPSYRVVITTVPVPIVNDIESTNRRGGNDKLQAEYIIRGLCKAQAFVDVIRMAVAVKARSHTARTVSDLV